MEKYKLGATGIEVTRLGVGSLTMSPIQRALSVEQGAEVILHALARGVNFIDTAQMYGSYPQVAAALRQWKGELPVVASKSAVKSAAAMEAAVSECLEQTGLGRVDIFLLHAVKDDEDLTARRGAIDYLLEARKKGLIKAIGASSHSARTIQRLSETPEIEVLHPMYNRDGIGILDASLDEMTAILKAARQNGKGVYAMKPLGGGHLRNEAAAALRWVFASDAVDAAVVGMTSIDEVDMNVGVVMGESISEDFAEKVAGQPRKLFINSSLCRNCGACIRTCQQQALIPGENSPSIEHARCILCGYCAPVCPMFAIRIV